MRYAVDVYDRHGRIEHHACATRAEALALAARLRRQRGPRDYVVVVTDTERPDYVIDDEDEPT